MRPEVTMGAKVAVDTRIDVIEKSGSGRKLKRAIISFHEAESFTKGYQFDCFQIEVLDGDTLFIPLVAIEPMLRLIPVVTEKTQDGE